MKHRLIVNGMTCGHCKASVTEAIAALDGAAHVEVNLQTGEVQVNSTRTLEEIRSAIEELGYEVQNTSTF
jgi:copper chaperone